MPLAHAAPASPASLAHQPPFRLGPFFGSLTDARSAIPVEVTPTFWQELTSGQLPHVEKGWLISFYSFEQSWNTWENHPLGEEVVIMLSGVVDFVMEVEGQETLTRLETPASFVIVPRNTWHTARVISPATMLFLTSGEGTQHRPVAPA